MIEIPPEFADGQAYLVYEYSTFHPGFRHYKPSGELCKRLVLDQTASSTTQ